MSNFTGMDINQVRVLSRQLQTRADEIRTITQQLTGQLNSTPWIGPDREQFHGEWTGQHTAALNSVVAGLEQASQTAMRNSNEQEQASSR
ncbi:MAG: hypothetical protein QNJ12_15120 [Ilumatobacter sp.]|uniref:hypothetical protein n=1 Tax=Ilumatobacter sp. TaxID=1967498 RepID=UPI0026115A03|nr:hypothetical protein [Ilumatobacter sp.]MDJ0770131.1 hypothetical protein [Ilumatobacter sp.]